MTLIEWASKWGVPPEALAELRAIMGTHAQGMISNLKKGMSEAAVQQRVRLSAAQQGLLLWRNNVGAYDPKNPPSPGTRWGLANDTKKLNSQVKSSDLIGIKPIVIQPEHVGTIVGQFIARECKKSGWAYGKGGKDQQARELAQNNFIELVTAAGGDAKFITGPENFYDA